MSYNFKQFIRDIEWSFASLGISAGINFILRVFLARYYGAGDLGLYTLAFTAYSFGLLASGFGISAGITKHVAEKREDVIFIKSLVTGGIGISLVTGFCAGLILYITSPYISIYFFKMPELTTLLRIVSLAFPFIALERATLGLLNGLRSMGLYSFITITQNILVIILTVVFALEGYDIKYAILSLVLPVILMSTISIVYVRKYVTRSKLEKYAPAVKVLLIFGFYGSLSNGLAFVQTYTDTTLLGYFMTNTDVGLFGTAMTILQIMWLPSFAIQMISGPIIAGYWGKNEMGNIERFSSSCIKYATVYAVSAAFVLGFLSKDILKLIFGADFVSASVPIQILLFGFVLTAAYAAIGSILSSTAFVSKIFIITGITLIINIGLNILLIPHLGINGAALASLTSMAASSIISLRLTQYLLKIKIDWAWFIKLFSFTLLLVLLTYLLGRLISPLISLALALIVLAGVVFKYFLSQEDKTLLINIVGRKNL